MSHHNQDIKSQNIWNNLECTVIGLSIEAMSFSFDSWTWSEWIVPNFPTDTTHFRMDEKYSRYSNSLDPNLREEVAKNISAKSQLTSTVYLFLQRLEIRVSHP